MKPGLILLAAAWLCSGQDFTQRGYVETSLFAFPQTAPGDSGRAVGTARFHYDASYRLTSGWRILGAVEADTDTHRAIERSLHFSWSDRESMRPAFALRRLSASYTSGKLVLEFGKQLIRWGKADILNPTDRFAPKDFLNVFHTEYLGVMASRIQYGTQANTVEAIYVPYFTPARMPLLNQRWATLPEGIPILDLGSQLPGGPQFGGRWNHIGASNEFSLSYFDGYNYLPLIDGRAAFLPLPTALIQRVYSRIRTYGADAAIPLKPFTVKFESAYFTSPRTNTDEYLIYVLQLERQVGEFFFLGGYAGQVVTRITGSPNFDPERGMTRSVLGRVGYTIDTNRSVSVEAALRQNGRGSLVKTEYTQALGGHWRATVGFVWIRGSADDFLGQFHRNSFATLGLRYSF
jgi:hypothetical protein